jgi:hypothetical protein
VHVLVSYVLLLQRQTLDPPLFHKVTKLKLEYGNRSPSNGTSFISTLIDLTTITEIILSGKTICEAIPNIITDLKNSFTQACNLTSLNICCDYNNRRSELTAQDICFMTPSHVKHLAASVKNLNEVKICLEQLEHLLTARFFYKRGSFSDLVTEWLEEKKKGSSYFIGAAYTKIWFVHNSIQLPEVRIGNKRMKLTVEDHNS